MYDNKVELRRHMATDFDSGKTVELGQWRVFVDNKHVGFLVQEPGSRLMPIVNMPEPAWNFVVSECERLRNGKVEPPIPFYEAPVEPDDEESDDE